MRKNRWDDLVTWVYPSVPEMVGNLSIQCPDCEEWSLSTEWRTGETDCEICYDSHFGIICPNCDKWFDWIGDYEFNVRRKDK